MTLWPRVLSDRYFSFNLNSFLLPSLHEDDNEYSRKLKEDRQGYLGWGGFGGSLFQWHPDLKIGFGYVPSRSNWYDFANLKSGELQAVVTKCAEESNNKK